MDTYTKKEVDEMINILRVEFNKKLETHTNYIYTLKQDMAVLVEKVKQIDQSKNS